jgi:hypothetical protein
MISKENKSSKTSNQEVMNKEAEGVVKVEIEILIIIVEEEEEIMNLEVMKIIKNQLKEVVSMEIISNHIKCIEVAKEEAIMEAIIVTEAIITKEVEVEANKKEMMKNQQHSINLHMRTEEEAVTTTLTKWEEAEAEEKDVEEETMRIKAEVAMDMKVEEEIMEAKAEVEVTMKEETEEAIGKIEVTEEATVVEEEEAITTKTNQENKMKMPFTEINLMRGEDIKEIMNKMKDKRSRHSNSKKI